jgi:hypothetical protein
MILLIFLMIRPLIYPSSIRIAKSESPVRGGANDLDWALSFLKKFVIFKENFEKGGKL